MSDDKPEPPRPGEKSPPAWTQREDVDGRPIPDEPPDSSSEVGQERSLPPAPGSADDDQPDDDGRSGETDPG